MPFLGITILGMPLIWAESNLIYKDRKNKFKFPSNNCSWDCGPSNETKIGRELPKRIRIINGIGEEMTWQKKGNKEDLDHHFNHNTGLLNLDRHFNHKNGLLNL